MNSFFNILVLICMLFTGQVQGDSDESIWKDLHTYYQKQEWVQKPSIFAETAIQFFPKKGMVLELGAGIGQDSIYFASLGYRVVSSDIEIDSLSSNLSHQSETIVNKITIEKIDLNKKLPIGSKFCFLPAAAIAGRNVVPAIYCKIGSLVIDCIDKRKAVMWRKSSREYWTQARKDAVRDLTVAAGVIMLGVGAAYYSKQLIEKPLTEENKSEEVVIKPYESRVEKAFNNSKRVLLDIKDHLSNFSNSSSQAISDNIKGLKDWAWQYRPVIIDTTAAIIGGGIIIKISHYLYNRPKIYNRLHHPIYGKNPTNARNE